MKKVFLTVQKPLNVFHVGNNAFGRRDILLIHIGATPFRFHAGTAGEHNDGFCKSKAVKIQNVVNLTVNVKQICRNILEIDSSNWLANYKLLAL